MIGRARHQQESVSGILLENVCVIFTSTGTAFHAVPEGVDGPAFCRQLVASYARPAVMPKSKLTFVHHVFRLFRAAHFVLGASVRGSKAGAK